MSPPVPNGPPSPSVTNIGQISMKSVVIERMVWDGVGSSWTIYGKECNLGVCLSERSGYQCCT